MEHTSEAADAARGGRGDARESRPLPPGLVLVAAVLAVSWAGPLVRFSDAPALAISLWRLILSVALLGAIVALRGNAAEIRTLSRRDRSLALLGGACLAAHFWTWIASLSLTSIASSVVLVNTQPVFVVALSALVLRELPVHRQAVGIGVAMVGALVIGWGDFHRGSAPLLGDALALAGAVFVAGYYVIGRELRQRLDIWNYALLIYGIAAVLLLGIVIAHPDVSVVGYARNDWLVFLALAVGPMLIGHTGVNYALRYVPAYVANLAILGEPVGATLIAWALPAIGEVPSVQTLIGGAVLLCGIAIGASAGTARQRV